MKKLVLFCVAALFCVMASAQKVYFLYLQSDDQSPFYVKMGDKIYSSAASGFLILPNLTESNYTFGLGFAKSTAAEAKFSISINQNDKGFLIKNLNEGLVLFDMLDLSLVKANSLQQDNTVYEIKSDKFSSILSKAADDPGLLKVPVAKKEESVKAKPAEKEAITAKIDETKPADKKPTTDDTIAPPSAETAKQETTETAPVETAIVTPTVQKEVKQTTVDPIPQEQKRDLVEESLPAFKRSVVSRYTESSTTEGFGVVYFDKKEEGVDTIRILIPAPKVKLATETEAAIKETSVVPLKTDNPVELKNNEVGAAKNETPAVVPSINTSVCKTVATDKDFLKLRKKMAAKENHEDMLDEARKEFKNRCYTVEQVRYLSTLFLTSAAKYQFFDAAYNAVSDKANFASLSSEIKDDHYTKRFQALIGE